MKVRFQRTQLTEFIRLLTEVVKLVSPWGFDENTCLLRVRLSVTSAFKRPHASQWGPIQSKHDCSGGTLCKLLLPLLIEGHPDPFVCIRSHRCRDNHVVVRQQDCVFEFKFVSSDTIDFERMHSWSKSRVRPGKIWIPECLPGLLVCILDQCIGTCLILLVLHKQ